MQVFNDNCKLSGITSGIANAAQQHELNIMPSEGKVIKEVSISQKGNASIIVKSSNLSSGVYSYSLLADEKVAGTKMMVKEK